MMNTLTKYLLTGLVCSSLLSVATAKAETLKWTGCGISKKAYITELAKAYEAKTGIDVKISGGGATKGIRAAAAGTADVGGACRFYLRGVSGDINQAEQNAEFVQVAWDALVVIAHPKNSVDSISMADLKKVFAGDITKWSQLGGADKRIALLTRKSMASGVGNMFRQLVYADQNHKFAAKSLTFKSTGPLEKKAAKLATAFAVDGISSAKKADVKVLALDGIKPSKENIASGEYPLYRPLYLVLNKKQATPQARDFVAFALSDEGQQVISNQGTVNLAEGKKLTPLWQAKAL